jgi:hypothetical protein
MNSLHFMAKYFATKAPRHKGIFQQKAFFVPLSLCGNFPVYPG